MERKFFCSDVESIESVCAVGAVFEQIFFRFGKFLAAFVFSETVAAAAYAGCLNGEDKVVVILSVEESHKALLAGKALVDEKIFLIVPHGIAEIDRLDSPAVTFKLMDDHPTEVLFVDGIVRAESGSIVVIDNSLITMRSVVSAEVCNDFGNLTLKLDVERLNDIEPPPIWLACDNPVDICYNIVTI